MANQGKISVELRLVLDKLNQDIKAAAASMRAGLSKDMGSTAAGTEKAANAQTKLAGEVKKTTNALKDQAKIAYDLWKASLPAPKIIDTTQEPAKKSGRFFKPWSTEAGGGLATDPNAISRPQRRQAPIGAVPPAMFPIPKPPVIPPPQMPTGWLAKVTQGGLGSPLAIAAQLGAALAGLRVAIGLVQFALHAILAPVRMLGRVFVEAAESARRLYAKALQSGGLGMGFVARRSALADVIGVSEEEVYSYGNAVRYLNSQLNFSTTVTALTNKELTSASWALRVIRHDFEALKNLFLVQLAPIVRELAAVFHGASMLLTREAVMWGKTIAFGIRAGLFAALGPIGNIIYEGLKKLGGGDKGPAPETEVATKRMPFSAWEKMGLVIGSGGVNDFAKQTASNTRKTVEKLERVVEILGGGGVPRFSFPSFNAL